MKKLLILFLCFGLLATTNFVSAAKPYATNKLSHFGFLSQGIGITPSGATELKIPWLRPHPGQAIWNELEPKQGSFNWSSLDKTVKSAQKINDNLLITIWPYADWDQITCHKSLKSASGFEEVLPEKRGAPCDYSAYKNFLTKMVERYDGDKKDDMKGLKYGVKYWEILNEPEMNTKNSPSLTFFQGTEKQYFKILKTSYATIKKTDSGAKVLHGGMAGTGGFMTKFWEKVFKLGAGKYFNIGNIHFINGQSSDLNAADYKNLLAKYNIKKSFWITEVQIQAGQKRTEEEQAADTIKGYVRAYTVGAKKAFYTIYKAQNGAPDDLNNSALIDTDSRKKPLYYAMQTMVSKIDYFTRIEFITDGQYKFTVGDKTIYVLWGTEDVLPIPQELQNVVVTVTDMGGNVSTKYGSEIILTNNPVFVE